MVEEISSNVAVAPTIQEQVNVNRAKTAAESEESPTTTSGQDTVSISKEAQELLNEEALIEEARSEASAEDNRIEALRLEDSDRKAALLKAELDRLQDIPEKEQAQPPEEDTEATRA